MFRLGRVPLQLGAKSGDVVVYGDHVPIIPYEYVADVGCCGCLMVQVRDGQADILCNECASLIGFVPVGDVESTMLGMTQPRVKEELDGAAAVGLLAVVRTKIEENWFGLAFPAECGRGDQLRMQHGKLKGAMAAYNLMWPADWPNRDDRVPAAHP